MGTYPPLVKCFAPRLTRWSKFDWPVYFVGRGEGWGRWHILCMLKKEYTEKSMMYLLPGNEKYPNGQIKESNSYLKKVCPKMRCTNYCLHIAHMK